MVAYQELPDVDGSLFVYSMSEVNILKSPLRRNSRRTRYAEDVCNTEI